MVDYHIHTDISFDAQGSMAGCVQVAQEKGLSEICITEHYDEGYPDSSVYREFDEALYDERIAQVRREAPGLIIRQGLEVGLIHSQLPKIRARLAGRQWDFIIGSQHIVGGKDPYYKSFFDYMTVKQGQKTYLDEMLACLSDFDNYDVVGHIGYIDKYLEYAGEPDAKPMQYRDYPDELDAILKTVIDGGKGIEINTSNYYIYDYPTPHESIIRRYFELGGEIVTLGSDAHFEHVVGNKIKEAGALLQACGGKYVCTFEARKPTFVPID